MPKSSPKCFKLICYLFLGCFLALPSVASAQYVAHPLIANIRQLRPRKIDSYLVDPWGITHVTPNKFWVANQNTSLATEYTENGAVLRRSVIHIPCVVGSTPVVPCTAAPESMSFPPTLGPTGLVRNTYASSEDFEISDGGTPKPATLLFDTIDGLIVGWNPSVSPDGVVAYNNNGNAVYKGLALAPSTIGPYLYASNNNKSGGGIDVYYQNFDSPSTFCPPTSTTTTTSCSPSTYHPHGVDIIDGYLYATYAGKAQGGLIYRCDLNSSPTDPTCSLFASSTSAPYNLNAPWGVALAPSDFGKFSGDLLVGNVNSGHIDALDPQTGDFLGTLDSPNGTPISYRGMWDLDFETSRSGKEQLFFAAGPGEGKALFSEGIFGFISSVGVQP